MHTARSRYDGGVSPGRSWSHALHRALVVGGLALTITVDIACRRKPAVPEATYRQAVTAFYVSLAAMQTSQDVIARTELEHLIQLLPDEAAGWANLGLLLLRQQQFDEASERLAKAASLAPRNAAIERLRGLNESRNGHLDRSVVHWRRAIELDPADLKAPFALAQDLERVGGPDNEAEAQRLLVTLATRSRNLAGQLEFARLAARRGDAAGLLKALEALAQRSSAWPAAAQERFTNVRELARTNPAAATTAVIFLKNVLIREPEYRSALAAVTTPRAEAGEPLLRLVTLPNPEPRPAPADEQLAFTVDTQPALSLNVALGQGNHEAPRGLSLEVADARGGFTTVRPGLGFPAGKDKTVLIDLAGIFPAAGPRRVRLRTNLEIFWDRLGWAGGRPDLTLTPRRLDLRSADLRFRGYSATGQKDASTPERPRYVLSGVAARWRDLEGFHTRFGDVRELLQAVDDRYVIMNAGDELRLTFPEAPAPQPGLVRDFVLVGDGWEKDGDYNTVASRTVLPLPTHASGSYSPGSGRLEDDPVYQRHRKDFEHYHTRYVSGEMARDALRGKIEPDQR
jgi:hypothetical protein